jgi:hypothetical protein
LDPDITYIRVKEGFIFNKCFGRHDRKVIGWSLLMDVEETSCSA